MNAVNDKNKKNIILIDVDALMPSRTGFGGGVKNVSPTLNKMYENSLSFSKAFSMGNPTEFALPGLFASSYLLDNGGYRYGISDTELTFAEVLKENGYSTSAFMTAFRPKHDGYERGFDDYYNLIDIQVTEKNLLNTSSWYRSHFLNKDSAIQKDECIKELTKYYDEYLDDILLYCDNWEEYIESEIVPRSSIFNNVDYNWIRNEVLKDKKIFNKDKNYYIKRHLMGGELGLSNITRKVIKKRNKKIRTSINDINIQLIIILNLFFSWMSGSSYRSKKNILGTMLDRILHGRKSFLTRYPSGEYIFQTFKNWLENKGDSGPFYSYIKLMDVHELNIYSHDICSEDKNNIHKKDLNRLKDIIRKLKVEGNYKGNVLYDLAIRYEDNVINKLLCFLSEKNLLDNTIVVITADHGGQFPNIPIRDESTHRVESFVDELYNIPLIFYNKDIDIKESEELVSSIDINPTLLDIIGIKPPDCFRGVSLLNNHKRKYVMSENQGRGPCHLKYKPIRVCVRSDKFKIIYDVPPLRPEEGRVAELYDLEKDKNEYENIVKNKAQLDSASWLVDIAKKRIVEIYQ